jgi:hypothetical protein
MDGEHEPQSQGRDGERATSRASVSRISRDIDGEHEPQSLGSDGNGASISRDIDDEDEPHYQGNEGERSVLRQ